ncbi:MAG: hypothetical protein ABSG76_25200 [Xanthobacteraceae bacterium]|jgi:hypothetical protein
MLIRLVKFLAILVAVASMLGGASTPSHAHSGTVHLRVVRAGFIVGVGGGSGTLTYHGRTYRLSVGGIGLGSFGIASARLAGTAANLRTASDIVGTYGAVGAGATFVGGAQVATLRNEKGVVLTVHGVQLGFQVSLGLAGMTIALR